MSNSITMQVQNVEFAFDRGIKTAHRIVCTHAGEQENIDLTEDDLVFVTNGSCTENSSLGDNDHAPVMNTEPGEGRLLAALAKHCKAAPRLWPPRKNTAPT